MVAAAVFFLGAVGAVGVEALFGATARDAAQVVRVGLILVKETLEVVGATIASCVVGRHVVGRLGRPLGGGVSRAAGATESLPAVGSSPS